MQQNEYIIEIQSESRNRTWKIKSFEGAHGNHSDLIESFMCIVDVCIYIYNVIVVVVVVVAVYATTAPTIEQQYKKQWNGINPDYLLRVHVYVNVQFK